MWKLNLRKNPLKYVPYLLSCLTSLVVYVLPCLTRCVPYGLLCFTYLVLFVLLCPTCLMSYAFSCLMCLALYVPLCLLHIMPYLSLCHTCLALYILSCLTRSRALFLASCMCQYHSFCSYVSAFHVTFSYLYPTYRLFRKNLLQSE